MTGNQFDVPCPSGTVVRTGWYAGVAVATALALAACGPTSAAGDSGAPAAGSTPAPTGGGGAGGQRQPGVNGLVAAVSGSTMQVQTRTDQTAVSWNNATTFTKIDPAAPADVTVGSCVTVLEPAATGSTTTSPSGPATEVTAGSVEVRPATNGQCTGGFGGFGDAGGTPPSGAPGAGATPPTGATPPANAPTGTGGPGGRGGAFGRGAFGLVTAVSGDTITVKETLGARGNGTGTATATPTTITVTVTTTGSTTYTAQKAAATSDVVVGECASAFGQADDTGAVTATSISLRPATNGTCTTGFGGSGAGGRPGATGTATTGGTNG